MQGGCILEDAARVKGTPRDPVVPGVHRAFFKGTTGVGAPQVQGGAVQHFALRLKLLKPLTNWQVP